MWDQAPGGPDDIDEKPRWRRPRTIVLIIVLAISAAYVLPRLLDDGSTEELDPGLRIDTVQQPSRSWFFPGTDISQLTGSPSCEDDAAWTAWAQRNKGWPADPSLVQVTVTATRDVTAIIDRFSVTRKDYKAPEGIVVGCRDDDIAAEQKVLVDLDPPVARARYEQADRLAFRLRKGDVERFVVIATGTRATFEWNAQIRVLTGIQHTEYQLTDRGADIRHIPGALYPRYLQESPGVFGPATTNP